MNIELGQIANTRSGDKGANSNVGIIFNNKKIYEWAKKEITSDVVKNHFKGIVKGRIIRYELDNILSMNFILEDSLGGGGSETLINDAQGKTHGQIMMMLKIDIPEHLIS
ncbi:MAG: hypothetical protein VX770_03595 [Candidatus Neomarinimicrobiota bacterium]|jgi:hypothetical protein|nr:hypothetical protein [Candidatus Neomarinimicrobiota bacterium]|tara:strand:- start:598 stop:927 length:330 start_codon:yes stop_codon:yes gene_type:complete